MKQKRSLLKSIDITLQVVYDQRRKINDILAKVQESPQLAPINVEE